ncbi:carbohydrate ABC transporter permease [Allonocardiopsis opalescens]|uniref:Carbohydrate ABC transporter membrane protein 1 (CUT1 family) n=1 Tax=Allonocardiopsis opalescens TaxID=1144618 RepID=A0A2T0PZ19_9ACTN|nr:sugar ABC transporter permease [Allonocardiopsis opalescens]PRX96796.1 carbohydrate ABC transporter membrane protein 1 (CUT1 family) [Allonocardiopsis opalescens]
MAATATPAPPARRRRTPRRPSDPAVAGRGRLLRWLPYLLVLPAVLMELLIHIVPMLIGIGMSFLRLTQFTIRNWTAAPFTGLDNYRVTLDFGGTAGAELLRSFGVTVAFTVIVVAASWAIGIFAGVLMQRPFRGRGFLRAFFLFPYALPAYAAVITWNFMLQRDNGLVNHVLVDQLGLFDERPFWLIGSNSFASLTVVAIWRLWPFAFLVIMAGLQSIPDDLYEAASIDGASIGRQFRAITMPMLRPINMVLVLVLFLWTFNDFNTAYVLFGNSVPAEAAVISVHIYQSSFVTWNFGLGSAMSVLLLLFLLLVSAAYLLFTSRRGRG